MATIAEMREQLQRMSADSHWNGDPSHLHTYYFDAIQALLRLDIQLANLERLRDNSTHTR